MAGTLTQHLIRPRLRRSRGDRIVAGVCGGLGVYFGVDALWFRLAVVALTFGGGSGLLLYLIAWVVIPEADEQDEAVDSALDGVGANSVVAGAVLVALGFVALVGHTLPMIGGFVWHLALIVIGVGLIAQGTQR